MSLQPLQLRADRALGLLGHRVADVCHDDLQRVAYRVHVRREALKRPPMPLHAVVEALEIGRHDPVERDDHLGDLRGRLGLLLGERRQLRGQHLRVRRAGLVSAAPNPNPPPPRRAPSSTQRPALHERRIKVHSNKLRL
ncbi:hypothetical protein DB30_00932 [Enhygromyxa salina]|uniref:Uncharacterized protein n=1 Tax=Enhygromyxa salina TaxID=215803 RepID=A0A0C2CTC8_9BACT|nr:hypothetical protein DB30_00932 [Enhygromyxa salina]